MSEPKQNNGIDFTPNATDNTAVSNDAAALLARLSTLDTNAPPLEKTQAETLYRRALEKAGLAGQNAAAATDDPTGTEELLSTKTAASKKKLIRWQRWGLSAAAALAVIALGSMALVRGGFGVAMENAEAEYRTEAAMDMTAAQTPAEAAPETEEAALYGSATEAAPKDILTADADVGTGAYTEYSRTGEAAESAAEECAAEETAEEPAAKEETNAAAESGVCNDAVDSGTATEGPTDALPGGAAQVKLLMVNGRLYRATALAVGPVAEDDDRTACIETVIAADEIPAENGQANFGAPGVPFVYWRSGVAVLLDGVWVFFEPVE